MCIAGLLVNSKLIGYFFYLQVQVEYAKSRLYGTI